MRGLAVLLAVAIFAAPAESRAAPTALPAADNNSEAACSEIHAALRALSDAEHQEAFALDLAAGGAASPAVIVAAHLADLLERSQDLRAALNRARRGARAHDAALEECIRAGFRALSTAEKLSSEVEEVLFGSDASSAAPPLKPDRAPPPPPR